MILQPHKPKLILAGGYKPSLEHYRTGGYARWYCSCGEVGYWSPEEELSTIRLSYARHARDHIHREDVLDMIEFDF